MADVKWIKLIVGMFDGESFKKIRGNSSKIGGISYRDKLTAVWFELLDFAGKSNQSGALTDGEGVPYTDLCEIADMLYRQIEEIELCFSFFIKARMIELSENVYYITNWEKHQNADKLDDIREKARIRQANFKERKRLNNTDVTQESHLGNAVGNAIGNAIGNAKSVTVTHLEDRKIEDRKIDKELEVINKAINKNINKDINKTSSSAEVDSTSTVDNVVFSLPLVDKSDFQIKQSIVSEFAELYPAVDILQDLRSMKGWLISHPKLKKTRSGIMKFINNWLTTSQNKARSLKTEQPQVKKQVCQTDFIKREYTDEQFKSLFERAKGDVLELEDDE